MEAARSDARKATVLQLLPGHLDDQLECLNHVHDLLTRRALRDAAAMSKLHNHSVRAAAR